MRNTGLDNCGIKIKNPKSKIQNAITGCWIRQELGCRGQGTGSRIYIPNPNDQNSNDKNKKF